MDTLFFRWMMTTLGFAVGGGLVGALSAMAMHRVRAHIAAAWPVRRLRSPGPSAIWRALTET